jgi:hypothetical protein
MYRRGSASKPQQHHQEKDKKKKRFIFKQITAKDFQFLSKVIELDVT